MLGLFHSRFPSIAFVTGQAMPPPGCADSGSDDPASESSEITSSEPKTYLVMSGGEGYIDFRIGGCIFAFFILFREAALKPFAKNVLDF